MLRYLCDPYAHLYDPFIIVFFTLLVLKLCGVATFSWWIVCSHLLVLAGLVLLALLIVGFYIAVCEVVL